LNGEDDGRFRITESIEGDFPVGRGGGGSFECEWRDPLVCGLGMLVWRLDVERELRVMREIESECALRCREQLFYEFSRRRRFREIFEIGKAGYLERTGELCGFKGVEKRREIRFREIEEVAVSRKCEKRTEKDHGTDLRFSIVNYYLQWTVPDAQWFWDFLTFLKIETMCVREQRMKSQQYDRRP